MNAPEDGLPGAPDREFTTLLVGNKQDDDNRLFGRLLRLWRRQRGLTAAQVAEAAHVTASFVRSIERGAQAPSEETAAAIAAVLGLPTDGPELRIIDPGTDHPYVVAFLAATKGDNSRSSIERLSRDASGNFDIARLAHYALHNPEIASQVADADAQEERERHRALGRYGITAGEHPDSVRNRVARRILHASDEEVATVHALLDQLGVSDPLDPVERYTDMGYPGRGR